MGDFNLMQNILLDRSENNTDDKVESRKIIQTYMEEKMLIDIWRTPNMDFKKYTWFWGWPNPTMSILDYFLISQSLMGQVEVSILPGYKTYHSLISLDPKLEDFVRGKDFWKLNLNHLDLPEYVQSIQNTNDLSLSQNAELTLGLLWEMVKINVAGEGIKFSKQKAKKKKKIKQLTFHWSK